MQAHAETADQVLAHQNVDPATGLSSGEVLARRNRFGPNELKTADRKGIFEILIDQLNGVIVWLLAGAAAFALFLGDVPEAVAIIIVLLINFAIGFFTELRAVRSMEALRRMARVSTSVRRDGVEQTVGAVELVPGDIVLLGEGNVVTADIRLISVAGMHCDESVMTGESVPVAKLDQPLALDITLGDKINMAFKGSAVTRGHAEGVVVATGMQTELGQISDMARKADSDVPPLERRLDRLGHRLVWLTLGLALVTILAGVARGYALTEMIQTGVALAVAAVPEGLPVVATLTLARGMWRMAARNALISNMPSVETLGATTLIMTDKTGTLTENRMAVARYILADGDLNIGPQDDRLGFAGEQGETCLEDRRAFAKALEIGALCNATSPAGDGPEGNAPGDPMERALLVAAQANGIDPIDLRDRCPLISEHPFDSDLRMMATTHTCGHEYLDAVKGAPEAVIRHCDHVLLNDGSSRVLDDAEQSRWEQRAEAAAGEGLRLLALAYRQETARISQPFDGLTLAGIVCLFDPIRPAVPEALGRAQKAGVRVVMVTGDHATTASTIARKSGLAGGDLTVIEGAEIRRLDFEALTEADRTRILQTDVFARVEPATKLKLARLFQKSGEIVAMTGDGVNDAPALKKADIGIAMGQRGTEVAREAADMVLKDDNFATIIAAMHQGRVILDNIRTFVLYLMSCNVSEILIVGLAVGFGLPTPLLPLQILFLNLVTDVFPAFALGLGQGDEKIMDRPPRDPNESILTAGHWALIGVLGALITVLTLSAFALALFYLELETEQAVTVSFLTLALAQLWNVFNMRTADSRVFVNEVSVNRSVWAALLLCIGLIAAALWLPALSEVLRLQDPGTDGLLLAVLVSLLHLVLGQMVVMMNLPRIRVTDRQPGKP